MPNPVINRRLLSGGSAGGGGNGSSLPQRPNLILQLESLIYDGTANGTAIGSWTDQSPAGNTFASILTGAPNNPTVSGSVLCNGHKTLRFDGTMGIGNANSIWANATQGVEMMIIFVRDFDPASGTLADQGEIAEFTSNNGSVQPFTDGNFYEGFGRTDRPSLGNPATSVAGAFVCYNVTSRADGTLYSAWVNSENFFTAGSGYTFRNVGAPQTLGVFFNGSVNGFSKCNIAAAYGWQVSLTTAERLQARQYMSRVWGIVF